MSNQQKVQVLYEAELNAREKFGLKSKAELLAFIGNDGLQDVTYVNTEIWRNNPKRNMDIYIDAYTFRSNQKTGYIAFMKGITCKYAIKSFHLNNDKLTTKDMISHSTKLLKEGR
jgi:penicillin-binding protein-related factor A (putative recombinase)